MAKRLIKYFLSALCLLKDAISLRI